MLRRLADLRRSRGASLLLCLALLAAPDAARAGPWVFGTAAAPPAAAPPAAATAAARKPRVSAAEEVARALEAAEGGACAGAAVRLTTVAARRPAYAAARLALGRAYFLCGRRREAAAAFHVARSLGLSPLEDADALRHLAVIAAEEGAPETAEAPRAPAAPTEASGARPQIRVATAAPATPAAPDPGPRLPVATTRTGTAAVALNFDGAGAVGGALRESGLLGRAQPVWRMGVTADASGTLHVAAAEGAMGLRFAPRSGLWGASVLARASAASSSARELGFNAELHADRALTDGATLTLRTLVGGASAGGEGWDAREIRAGLGAALTLAGGGGRSATLNAGYVQHFGLAAASRSADLSLGLATEAEGPAGLVARGSAWGVARRERGMRGGRAQVESGLDARLSAAAALDPVDAWLGVSATRNAAGVAAATVSLGLRAAF